MGQKKQPKFTDEFKREAVRILLSYDRTISEIATNLGICKSTLVRPLRSSNPFAASAHRTSGGLSVLATY